MAEGDTNRQRSIAVVMTCHNRRDTTVACLRALAAQRSAADLSLFVTDDGSSDGTADAIRDVWPDATIIPGPGSLYWAAGMALAEVAALTSDPDYLLWLNDDTVVKPGALEHLLALSDGNPTAVIVGATQDPETGSPTYGGRVRVDYHPQRFRLLPIAEAPQRADTFNGNLVLVPKAAHVRIGPIDGAFPHAYADDDYGLRATALGVPIFQVPGTVATCRDNDIQLPSGGLASRWRHLQSPKGLPWRAQARYLRRHGDWRWPLLLVGGQVRRVFRWGQ
jgi:GT2 family glycosyltransferase